MNGAGDEVSLGQIETLEASIHTVCSDFLPVAFNQLVAGSSPARPTIFKAFSVIGHSHCPITCLLSHSELHQVAFATVALGHLTTRMPQQHLRLVR
jgi:hypothetical protein